EQWTGQELGAESFIAALQDAVVRLLGAAPEARFATVIQTLLTPADGDNGASRPPTTVAPEMVIDVLRELDQLLGRADVDALNQQGGRIPEALNEASEVLVGQWGQRLTELVVHLVDEPDYRLAGAEEAMRQIISRIERALENHEKLGKELAQKAGD